MALRFASRIADSASEYEYDRRRSLRLAELGRRRYAATATGLGAEVTSPVTLERRKRDAYYALRPEYVESLLHLYRATKDDVYRERGWVVFEALRRHCRRPASDVGAATAVFPGRPPEPHRCPETI